VCGPRWRSGWLCFPTVTRGTDATSPATTCLLGTGATDDKPPSTHEDHDLRLEVCHERGRGLDVGRARGSGAVQEMKVWPFGAALRGEASNRHMLRWLKTVVVSDVEKAHVMRQVGIRKTVRSPRCGDRC
jgi:hypothetical protein